MEEKKKVLMLVGVIPPFTCEDKYLKQMEEYYLLKAKVSLPDLKWTLKVLKEIQENKPIEKKEVKPNSSHD